MPVVPVNVARPLLPSEITNRRIHSAITAGKPDSPTLDAPHGTLSRSGTHNAPEPNHLQPHPINPSPTSTISPLPPSTLTKQISKVIPPRPPVVPTLNPDEDSPTHHKAKADIPLAYPGKDPATPTGEKASPDRHQDIDIDDELFDWFHVEEPASDEEEEENEFDDHKNKRTCNWFYELPNWARCFVLLFPGSLILATPAIVAVAAVRKDGDPNLFDNVGDTLYLSTEILRWSVWVTLNWAVWIVLWYLVDAVPYMVVQICNITFGFCSERMRSRLEYVVALKVFITILIWAILVVVLYAILFNQQDKITYWHTTFQILIIAMVFAICLFLQKLALQIIAVNFHRIAYADRIRASKRAMRVLDRLRRSIKNRVFTEYFVPAEVEAARAKKRAQELNAELSASPTTSPESPNPLHPLNRTIIVADHGETSEESGNESSNARENRRSRRGNPLYWVSRMKISGSRQSSPDDSTADLSQINLVRLQQMSVGPEAQPTPQRSPLAAEDSTTSSSTSVLQTQPSTLKFRDPETFKADQYKIEEVPAQQSGHSLLVPAPLFSEPSRASRVSPPGILSRQPTSLSRPRKSVNLPPPLAISARPSRVSMTRTPSSAAMPVTPEAILDAAMANQESPDLGRFGTLSPADKIKPTINALKDFQGRKYQKEIERLDITSQMHAGKLAKKLFASLGGRVKGYLTIEDFEPYFPNIESASAAFAIFDSDGNGSLTRRELKDSVIHMYKDRRGLFRALRDLSQAVGKLNRVFYIVSGVVTFCVALGVFGVPLSAMLPFTSFVLALSFVFGGAAKQTFECLLFLFVTHPYDAGDRVIIDGTAYIVENVGVLTTVFMRSDGQMSESIALDFDFHTPEEKIRSLRAKMLEFVQSESREFQPTCDIHITEIEELNKMKCTIGLKHKGNWQDAGKRMNRRTRFFFALKRNIEELGIRYAKPPQFPFPPPYAAEHDKVEKESDDEGGMDKANGGDAL
ncbi:hypothetical protein HDV00_003258 [Rhizophlyctis rosea]|nr:hypothetical protein HDV00_003258 [Rhizophlyctis rosea]